MRDAVLNDALALQKTILLNVDEVVGIRIERIMPGEQDRTHPSAQLPDMVGGVLRVEGQLDPRDLGAQGGFRLHRGVTVDHYDGSRGGAAADTVEPHTKKVCGPDSVITENFSVGVDASLISIRAPPSRANDIGPHCLVTRTFPQIMVAPKKLFDAPHIISANPELGRVAGIELLQLVSSCILA